MKKLLLIFIIIVNISCTKKSNKIIFSSNPAFFRGFTLEMQSQNDEVLITIPAEFFVSDTISKTYFRFVDSLEFEKIKKFVPQDNKFKFKLTKKEIARLEESLNSLSKIPFAKANPPNDGITIALENVVENKKTVHVFYSPQNDSHAGKIIMEIYNQLAEITSSNSIIENAIENSQRYFDDKVLKVKSRNPLYIKVLNEDCDDLEKEIQKLPNGNKIYLDITNIRRYKNSCLEECLRKKYSKISLIGIQMFYDE